MRDGQVRVFVAGERTPVCDGVRALLPRIAGVALVGASTPVPVALGRAHLAADLVVAPFVPADDDDGSRARAAVDAFTPRPVLFVIPEREDERCAQLLEAGAAGVLPMEALEDSLGAAVHAVARGDVYVRPEAAAALARAIRRHAPSHEDHARVSRLTSRERDVLRFVAQGFSAPEIGERLAISPKTVDTYKQRIHEKSGIAHRHEYVRLAMRLGMMG